MTFQKFHILDNLDPGHRVFRRMKPPHQPLQLHIKLESDKDQSPVFRYERHLCHPHPTVLDQISNNLQNRDL